MFRKSMTAALLAGAMVLAGCGSTAGSGQSDTGMTGSSSPSASAPAGSASAGSAGSAGAGSASAGSASAGSASAPDQPTVTVGGDVDAQTAAWFTTFCQGMAPLTDSVPSFSASAASDPSAMKKQFVDYFSKLGDVMVDTANKLKPLPPPTFDKGSEIASKVVNGLAKAGPAVKKSAEKLASADASSQTALQSAIADASKDMNKEMDAVDLNGFELDDKTQAAIAKLPACSAFFSGMEGSSAPTG